MEETTIYKIVIAIVLLVFWGYGSGMLTTDSSLALPVIPFALGMSTIITIVIQLGLRESVQAKMKKLLDLEIEERREKLIGELKDLVSYLDKEKYPSYSDSGAEGLEDDFQEFDSIKSKYTFQPKIIRSAIFIVLSSLILVLYWMNPSLWVYVNPEGYTFTLAHLGLGLLVIGLWMVLNILIASLELKVWEKD